MMQLAILHFHLNRGGVAQVIHNHLRALARGSDEQRPERVVILYGGRSHDWPADLFPEGPELPVDIVALPGLEYDSLSAGGVGVASPAELAESIAGALSERGYRPARTLLHVHNHALGKNASLPGALRILAGAGFRMLLQVHDFAEDFRPDNYQHLADTLGAADPQDLAVQVYPQGRAIHYAVLTTRDRAVLDGAGVDRERLHLLPNPVAGFGPAVDREAARGSVRRSLGIEPNGRLVVYPVRGIRRKNLGEMLLLAGLSRDTTFAVTLAPLNRSEQSSFQRWRALADELGLPCRFDTGGQGGIAYSDMTAAADALLTTSIAEGFGMVFLESWLAGQALIGRNLAEITADFVAAGVQLPWLYERLAIPIAWIGRDEFARSLQAAYRGVCDAYRAGIAADDADLLTRIDRLILDDTVDFALLSSGQQADVIRRVWSDRSAAAEVLAAGSGLVESLAIQTPAAERVVAANRAQIGRKFSLDAAGTRLANVYHRVMTSDAAAAEEGLGDGAAILEWFLDVSRLHQIRLE